MPQARSRYLVFTSAGDNSRVQLWLDGARDWDLWLCYYGDGVHPCAQDCEHYFVRKGGKFPNLHFAFSRWGDVLRRYDAILVLDDDLVIDAGRLNRLFEYRERYDLWVLQPAFTGRGKISHAITRVRPFRLLTYTNFVEVTAMLFRRDKLERFLAEYDPRLVGWGIDYWCSHLYGGRPDRMAVVHAISGENPPDSAKSRGREIEALQTTAERRATWSRIRGQRGIPECDPREYASLAMPLSPANLLASVKTLLGETLCRMLQARGQKGASDD